MQPAQPRPSVQLLDRTLVVFGCALLVALFGTVLLGIVTRALNEPLTWTDEGARLLMVWLACAGWIVAGRQRAHVRISFFLDRVPPRLQRATNVLIQTILVALGAIVGGFGVLLVQRNLDMDANALPISAAWLYAPIVPAGAALAMQSVIQLLDLLRAPPASAAGMLAPDGAVLHRFVPTGMPLPEGLLQCVRESDRRRALAP